MGAPAGTGVDGCESDSSRSKTPSTPKVVDHDSQSAGSNAQRTPRGASIVWSFCAISRADRSFDRAGSGADEGSRSIELAACNDVRIISTIGARVRSGHRHGPFTRRVSRCAHPCASGPGRAILIGRSALENVQRHGVIYPHSGCLGAARAAADRQGRRFLRTAGGRCYGDGMPAPRRATPSSAADEPTQRVPPQPTLPRRGRHPVGLARVPLRRLVQGRAPRPETRRIDRRREQLPLPPGFVDRRAA